MKSLGGKEVLQESKTVLVIVGTDHHQFNRLVHWMDDWHQQVDCETEPVRCVVQYGSSEAPSSGQGQTYFTRRELDEQLFRADAVVCHGGPSTIVEVIRRGIMPIVLPRSPLLLEHVDHHQERFAAHMSLQGYISLVTTSKELADQLDSVLGAAESCRPVPPMLPDPSASAGKLAQAVAKLVARKVPCRTKFLFHIFQRRRRLTQSRRYG